MYLFLFPFEAPISWKFSFEPELLQFKKEALKGDLCNMA